MKKIINEATFTIKWGKCTNNYNKLKDNEKKNGKK